jgi:hypothetical protein
VLQVGCFCYGTFAAVADRVVFWKKEGLFTTA